MLIVTLFSFWVLALLLFWPVSEAERELLQYFDLLACAILFLDFVVTTYRSPNSGRHFVRGGGWTNLLGCAPAIPGLPWIGLLRLARLRRVVQTARALRTHGLRAVRAELRAHRARLAVSHGYRTLSRSTPSAAGTLCAALGVCGSLVTVRVEKMRDGLQR